MWEAAWEKIGASVLATSTAEHRGIAYLWDSDDEFRGLCLEMLALHRVNGDQLDISQVTELLFKSSEGNGLLVELQFPPMPIGSVKPKDDGDPYHRLMAAMAFKTGDWAAAQRAMESIPYDDVVLMCEELDKAHRNVGKVTSKAKAKAPQNPDDDDDFAKVEKVALADIRARMQNNDPIAAIRAAVQSKGTRTQQSPVPQGDGSTAPRQSTEQ